MSDEEEVGESAGDADRPRRADLDQPDDDVPSERPSSRRPAGGASEPALRSAAVNAIAGADGDDTVVDRPAPGDREPPVVASAGAAGATTRSSSGGEVDGESEGVNRRFVALAVAAGILLAVGVFLALPRNQSSGFEGDALSTGAAVEIQESRGTTVVTDPDQPATTAAPVATTAAVSTTTAPTTTPETTQPTTPPTTAPLSPANIQVTYPRDGAGNMLLLAGATSAVVINNTGGQSGTYSVTSDGAVTLGAGASGTVPGGSSTQVAIVADSTSPGGPGPHGTVLVTGPDGVLAEISVIIS